MGLSQKRNKSGAATEEESSLVSQPLTIQLHKIRALCVMSPSMCSLGTLTGVVFQTHSVLIYGLFSQTLALYLFIFAVVCVATISSPRLYCCHHDSVRRDKKAYYRQFLWFQVFWHSGLQIKRKKCPPGLEDVALHIKSSSLAGSTEWQLLWNISCVYSDSSLIRSGWIGVRSLWFSVWYTVLSLTWLCAPFESHAFWVWPHIFHPKPPLPGWKVLYK